MTREFTPEQLQCIDPEIQPLIVELNRLLCCKTTHFSCAGFGPSVGGGAIDWPAPPPFIERSDHKSYHTVQSETAWRSIEPYISVEWDLQHRLEAFLVHDEIVKSGWECRTSRYDEGLTFEYRYVTRDDERKKSALSCFLGIVRRWKSVESERTAQAETDGQLWTGIGHHKGNGLEPTGHHERRLNPADEETLLKHSKATRYCMGAP